MLIPPATVAMLQQLNAANLPHSAQVQAQTPNRQPGGVDVLAWTPVATLPCRLSAPGSTPQERLRADQIEAVVAATVVFAAGASVHTAHRLIVSGVDAVGAPFTTAPLYVVAMAPKTSPQAMHKVECSAAGT